MSARTDRVNSVRDSRPGKVSATDLDIGKRALIATGTLESFRCAYGQCDVAEDGSMAIDEACARTLDVVAGDEVWSVPR